jgi:hypothetical protein
MLRRLQERIRIVILMTSNKKSNHIVIFFTLLTSHTTVQSTATSEIELREISRSFGFYGYFVANDLNFKVADRCFRVLDYSL